MNIEPIDNKKNLTVKRARINYETIFNYLENNITVFVTDMNRYNARYFKKLLKNKKMYNISVIPAFDEELKKSGYIITKNEK